MCHFIPAVALSTMTQPGFAEEDYPALGSSNKMGKGSRPSYLYMVGICRVLGTVCECDYHMT